MKHKIETIVTAIDLYYRGLSLRQITEHMQSTQKTKISHTTIQNWIKKYVSLLTQYMQDLKPNTSDRWHADETLIPVSGRHLRLWALLDSDTRFLIASHISKKQTTEDARILFKKGKERTEKCPSEIVTDGLSAYPKAIKAEIATSIENPVIHLHSSLTKAYNNKMERLMGTIKYRTKPMLGLYDENSADFFSDGFSIYYNYIRNHSSLNNQTPAVAAGIIKDKMTWLDLIEKTENNILSNNKKRDGCN
jgi:transposase-like protein